MSKNKEAIIKKIYFLIDFAEKEKNNTQYTNPYIQKYLKMVIDFSKSINYRLPKDIHLKICKNCLSLRDGSNTKTRTETRQVNHEKKKYLKLHCLLCGKIKKINLSRKNQPKDYKKTSKKHI